MADTIVISTKYRTPTTATRRDTGGVVLRQGHRYVALDAGELDAVVEFANDAPRLGELQCFPIATKSPQTDE